MPAHIRTRMARGERGLVWVQPPLHRDTLTDRGMRTGASRLGISYEAYAANVKAGLRWCSHHQAWQPIGEFGRDRGTTDGVARICSTGRREHQAAWRTRQPS